MHKKTIQCLGCGKVIRLAIHHSEIKDLKCDICLSKMDSFVAK